VLPAWYDVDDVETLRRLVGELIGGRRFHSECTAEPIAGATRGQLNAMLGSTDLSLRLEAEPS
jgi:hypothetical protein